MADFDCILVGGGLHNGLMALALLHKQPLLRIALIEKSDRLGGNHTWSCHAQDVPAAEMAWFAPLIQWQWPAYDVFFAGTQRTVISNYHTFTGDYLHEVVQRAFALRPDCGVFLNSTIVQVGANQAVFSDGRRLSAQVVFDARGPDATVQRPNTGYQKFLGLELEFTAPHGMQRPILLDTRVAQDDGLHFVYVLPFSATRALVEQTYFSQNPDLDCDRLRRQVHDWAQSKGLVVAQVAREEAAVLPMPYAMPRIQIPDISEDKPLVLGFGHGWFHPATGYSLPWAVRAAATAADQPFNAHRVLADLADVHAEQLGFMLLLNRLLFTATQPQLCWHIFQRFYTLPAPLIERFYAMRLTLLDRGRMMAGRPPKGVSLRSAARAFAQAARAGNL